PGWCPRYYQHKFVTPEHSSQIGAMNSEKAKRRADLVVVVNGFPRLSETFVLQEVLELERRGLRVHLVALTDPDEIVQQEAIGELHADVEHLPESPDQTSK